ncbi:MAG: 50S ribosomal protein L16 [Candidatus Micrarchaeales archaeon]|nr:50S ribosomal protein L16 [Candidatus Micrarchaeales archaeon]
MARLRPGRTCRTPNSQAWARFSIRKPRKNFIRALPHTSIQVFNSGVDKTEYELKAYLAPEQPIQLRSNALEAARLVALRQLTESIPESFYLKLLVYPHNVIREHKMASGAGADRVSRGMSQAWGRPVSVAARIRKTQPVLLIKTAKANRNIAVDALKRAAKKLSGKYRVIVAA